MTFRPTVWAPFATRLLIEARGGAHAMDRSQDGWWHSLLELVHGDDYAFRVDDDGPFPDPRSAWQPHGVHAASRVFDASRFDWNDAGAKLPSWKEAVVYELHVGTFTQQGTFAAATGKLDELLELGVTHIELMPVAAFPGERGWGYDGVALYAPHESYGGPQGLQAFVDACHVAGLRVLLDVVYNHLGPDGNVLARYGPYFTDRYRTPWGEAVNFDGAHSDEVRRFFVENACMWIRDYHIDGLRIDAVHAIHDSSAIHILEQLHRETCKLRTVAGDPPVIVIESDRNDPRPIHSDERGGFGLDGLWNEDFHHALHASLARERQGYYRDYAGVRDIATALEQGFVYNGRYSEYRQCTHGRDANVLPGRLVGFIQNHDQVGNRAMGDRIGMSAGNQAQSVGAALVLLSPFVPLIFQGEEWAAASPFPYFTDFDSPELADAVREGRRREFAAFGWQPEDIPDPQSKETFARAKLDWDERGLPPHAGMLDWYGRLLALRRELLRDGALQDWPRVRFDDEARWLVVDHGKLVITCNLDDEDHHIPLPAGRKLGLREASGKVERDSTGVLLGSVSVGVLQAP